MRHKVVFEVSGGVVQAVYAAPNIEVILIDWDTEGCSTDDLGISAIHDEHDREVLVNCCNYETTRIYKMPVVTKAALGTVQKI